MDVRHRRQEKSPLFVELFDLKNGLQPGINLSLQTHKTPEGYWQERYRWLEYEEEFDYRVAEFRPPAPPIFQYKEISKLKRVMKSGFPIIDVDGETISQVYRKISTILRNSNEHKTDCVDILKLPFVHVELEDPAYPLHTNSEANFKDVKKDNTELSKCCVEKTETCCILTGVVAEQFSNFCCIVRIHNLLEPQGMVEINRPLKYIIILLTQEATLAESTSRLGHTLGGMLLNKEFRESFMRATETQHIYSACKIFVADSFVQNVSQKYICDRCDEESIDCNDQLIIESLEDHSVLSSDDEESYPFEFKENGNICTKRFCPPVRDLVFGMLQFSRRFPSDFKDAFSKSNFPVAISSILFIYFVVFAPAMTFGTLMAKEVNPVYSVSNSILASGFTTIIYAILSGQPTAIIGPSGPGFILERLIAQESRAYQVEYFTFRVWVLIYAIIAGIILICLNLSALALYSKRSTEELFSAFISGFLIIKALFSLFRPLPESLPTSATLNAVEAKQVREAGAAAANTFIALLMTCFSLVVVNFKTSHLARRKFRFWIGALNVPIGIILMAGCERVFFASYDVPRLKVPPFSQINYTTWFNIPQFDRILDFGNNSAAVIHGQAVIYGFILGFLIFVEIALNSIVALRGKSIKPSPLAVDHFVCSIVCPILALVLGLPLVSGVPIRTIANMVALAKLDLHPAPGKQAQVMYLVEQRVSVLTVGILVTLSVFFGDVLQYIPVAALLGLFLFLGIFGLRGLQFKKIFTAIFSRRKYWSNWNILDGLPRPQVVIFSFIWFLELFLLLLMLTFGEFDSLLIFATPIPFLLVLSVVIRVVVFPHWKWMAKYLEKLDPPCVPDYKKRLRER